MIHNIVLGLLTYYALINSIEFVTGVLDKCDKYSIVLIYLKKVFNYIYHTTLVMKLHVYGDTALNLIINYNNHKQYLNINDGNSILLDINGGIPHGSVLETI